MKIVRLSKLYSNHGENCKQNLIVSRYNSALGANEHFVHVLALLGGIRENSP